MRHDIVTSDEERRQAWIASCARNDGSWLTAICVVFITMTENVRVVIFLFEKKLSIWYNYLTK